MGFPADRLSADEVGEVRRLARGLSRGDALRCLAEDVLGGVAVPTGAVPWLVGSAAGGPPRWRRIALSAWLLGLADLEPAALVPAFSVLRSQALAPRYVNPLAGGALGLFAGLGAAGVLYPAAAALSWWFPGRWSGVYASMPEVLAGLGALAVPAGVVLGPMWAGARGSVVRAAALRALGRQGDTWVIGAAAGVCTHQTAVGAAAAGALADLAARAEGHPQAEIPRADSALAQRLVSGLSACIVFGDPLGGDILTRALLTILARIGPGSAAEDVGRLLPRLRDPALRAHAVEVYRVLEARLGHETAYGHLLRPAEAPDPARQLLRPAAGVGDQPPEQLLRPADDLSLAQRAETGNEKGSEAVQVVRPAG